MSTRQPALAQYLKQQQTSKKNMFNGVQNVSVDHQLTSPDVFDDRNQQPLAQYQQTLPKNMLNGGKLIPQNVSVDDQLTSLDVFDDISLSDINNIDLSTTVMQEPETAQSVIKPEKKTNRRRFNEEDILKEVRTIYRKSMERALEETCGAVAKMLKHKPKNSSKTFDDPNYGFKRPLALTERTCEFLGVPYETKLSRPQLSREIGRYIKENNLKDTASSRVVIDGALARLFGIEQSQVPTIVYKEINTKYLSGCFTKFAS